MKQILNIKPYEDFIKFSRNRVWPYCTCKYMNWLSIFQYYGVNEIAIMTMLRYKYMFIEDDRRIAFTYRGISYREEKKILEESGISIREHSNKSSNTLGAIKECLDKGHPVICLADIYYIEGRKYYFHKWHGGHFILFTGYDDEKHTFYIMDNPENYDIYEYSYEFVEMLLNRTEHISRGNEDFTLMWEFCYNKIVDTWSQKHIEMVLDRFIKDVKSDGRNEESLEDPFMHLSNRLDELINLEAFPENIESTIYRRISELYSSVFLKKYGLYCNEEFKYAENLTLNIIDEWKKFRIKVLYKQEKESTRINDLYPIIDQIKSWELELEKWMKSANSKLIQDIYR